MDTPRCTNCNAFLSRFNHGNDGLCQPCRPEEVAEHRDDLGETLNGPRLYAWLVERDPESDGETLENAEGRFGAQGARRVYSWRKGSQAKLKTAEAILYKMNIELWEVPDDLYEELRSRRELTKDEREGIAKAVLIDKESRGKVARTFGRDLKTVNRAVEKYENYEEALQSAA
jgi:hypothetical protein